MAFIERYFPLALCRKFSSTGDLFDAHPYPLLPMHEKVKGLSLQIWSFSAELGRRCVQCFASRQLRSIATLCTLRYSQKDGGICPSFTIDSSPLLLVAVSFAALLEKYAATVFAVNRASNFS